MLVDDAKGMHPTDIVYDDADAVQMASLAPTQMHREVDLELIKADEEGYIKSYIVLPSTIYGVAKNKLTALKVANDRSQQIPQLVGASLERGTAGMVGEGKNIWPNVHIDDSESSVTSVCCPGLNISDKLPLSISNSSKLFRRGTPQQLTAKRAITSASQVITLCMKSRNVLRNSCMSLV